MITYFHRNIGAGFSINKVTQTVISQIKDKEEFFAPSYRGRLIDVFRNIIYVWKHRNPTGYNHITGGIHYGVIGLIGCKSILTIHDIAMVEYFPCSTLKKWILELLWIRIPLILANQVVCISSETKRSLMKYTNRKDIKVIYNAIDPVFKKSPKDFNGICPNILIIGTAPNKNLIKTFDALADINCEVTIIGLLSQEHIERLRLNNINYTNKANLSDGEIKQEYENADIISFVSKYEGFGMLVIEGNKVGRPVICSNIPVLKEVGLDAAFYVDPDNVMDIRKGFQKLINDEDLRQQLVENGYNNVKRFEREEILRQWLNLYK